MKRYLIAVLPILLMGCKTEAERKASFDDDLGRIIANRSTIVCADGNMVRMVGRNIGGETGLLTGWNILDAEGKPKRCPERHVSAPVQLEASDPYVIY